MLDFNPCTVLLTKRWKNENVLFFSHNSVTKHDVETPITLLESACIFASLCEFMLCHVMYLRFRTATSNIGLKQHFLFITHERNGVKASNLQNNCTIIVCMSMSSLIVTRPLVMEIGSRL